jgi:hypothetical protein
MNKSESRADEMAAPQFEHGWGSIFDTDGVTGFGPFYLLGFSHWTARPRTHGPR